MPTHRAPYRESKGYARRNCRPEKAVEKDFRNAQAHKDYIIAAGVESKDVQKQYDAWIKANPRSVEIPFAFAEALYNKELPAAKPYLEKVVKLDPNNGKAYQMLWIDAERWGDFAAGREYLRKATVADPKSADYAFYYASSHEDVDSRSTTTSCSPCPTATLVRKEPRRHFIGWRSVRSILP